MDYFELITAIADSKLEYINKYGYAKAGCNGPYKNIDTPVRNSGHWLITYAYLYKQKGQNKYLVAAEKLATYLLNEKNYGRSRSICHRKDARFDKTNGLIGQAWTIEALLTAAEFFNDSKYYNKAKELFTTQHFNAENNMWEVVDCDGSKGFDLTFNHQLWFAAAGAMILKYEAESKISCSKEIGNQIQSFLYLSEQKYFKVHEDGLIVHVTGYELTKKEREYQRRLSQKRKLMSMISNPIKILTKKMSNKKVKFNFTDGLEKGYHIFDLYGFALLKEQYGNHDIFSSEKMQRALTYAMDTNAMLELMEPCGGNSFNKFAFAYNSPAFEYPFVNAVLGNKRSLEKNKRLLEFQIQNTYDTEKKSFIRQCDDSETMDARIYELVRFLELEA